MTHSKPFDYFFSFFSKCVYSARTNFVISGALIFRSFYNSDLYEHGLRWYPVPLVYNTGYSIQ